MPPPGPGSGGAGGSGGAPAMEPPLFCPDPTAPRVHYQSQDYSKCAGKTLDCTTEQNGFSNACGCGCIDKGEGGCPPVFRGGVTYVSLDPAMCSSVPTCDLGQYGFSNSCGCGCTTPGAE